jgi:hypothetical protein
MPDLSESILCAPHSVRLYTCLWCVRCTPHTASVVIAMPCYREEGLINGLYRGIAANFSCSCVQGAAEIVTYDFTKETALKHGFADSMPLHLAAGVTAKVLCSVIEVA